MDRRSGSGLEPGGRGDLGQEQAGARVLRIPRQDGLVAADGLSGSAQLEVHLGQPEQGGTVVAGVEGAAEQGRGSVAPPQPREAIPGPAEHLPVPGIGLQDLVPVGRRLLEAALSAQGVSQPEDRVGIVGIQGEGLAEMVFRPMEIQFPATQVPGHGADVQQARGEGQKLLPAGQRFLRAMRLLVQVAEPHEGIAVPRIVMQGGLVVGGGPLQLAGPSAGVPHAGLDGNIARVEDEVAVPGLEASPGLAEPAVGLGQSPQGLGMARIPFQGAQVVPARGPEIPGLGARGTRLDPTLEGSDPFA